MVIGAGPDLAAANALTALSSSMLRLTAPPLGALLLAGPGLTCVVLTDVASYLASAALVARAGHHAAGARQPPPPERHPAAGLRAGLRQVARVPLLRGLLVGNGVFLTANAALTVLLVPFITEQLHAPGYGLGYLISGLGVGFVAGSALSGRILGRFSSRQILVTAHLAGGGAYFALFNAPDLAAAVMAATLVGLPGSILLVCVETHVQRAATAGTLGRVGAIFFATDSLAAVAGALGAPALVAVLGLARALNTISAGALLAAPLTWKLLPNPPSLAAAPATDTAHGQAATNPASVPSGQQSHPSSSEYPRR